MSSSLYNIEKLNESNYDSWSIQLMSVLIHQELWSVASGSSTKPEPNATNASEIALWQTKDEKAKATIILSITPTQIMHVKHCKSANVAWNALREIHQPKGPARKVTLFKMLLRMRMTDDECVQQYVGKFSAAAEKLAEIGVNLQEELFVIMLLASLPKSYENLVVALESRDELPSLSSVKIKLIEEGERRKVISTDSNSTEPGVQAFMAHDGAHIKPKNFGNTASNNNSGTAGNSKRQFKCYNCGHKGHYAAQCKEKKAAREHKNNSNNNNKYKNGLFAAASNSILHANAWCVDSGASSHLCCNRNMFDVFEIYEETIMLAGDNKIQAKGKGIVRLQTTEYDVTLYDVLFVPELQCNFISVAKAVNYGYSVMFRGQSAIIRDKHGAITLCANKVSDLFLFQTDKNKLFYARANTDEAEKWHRRFGHLNFASLRELSNKQLVRGMCVNFPTDISCSVCMQNKCVQKSYSSSNSRAKELLEIVHSDVCGPIKNTSVGGSKYVLTFIDDKSRYVFVYFLKGKDQVFEKFKEFKTMVERQTDKKLKILRSDNGKEFVNNAFDKYLKEHGILRQLTVPYTPQQNGTAERFNRTLIEMARCMLVGAGTLWAEAVYTAAYLRNRAPTRSLNNCTPYEIWYGHKPSVAHLRTFGSVAVALDKRQHGKFKPRGKEYSMVGYSDTSKAYRLYDKSTSQLIVSRDVYFIEKLEPTHNADLTLEFTQDESMHVDCVTPIVSDAETTHHNEIEPTEEASVEEVSDDNGCADEEVPRRGPGRPRLIRSGAPGRPKKQYNVLSLMCSEVPMTVKEALSSECADEWWAAMQSEYKALLKNNTWQMTQLPKGQKVVGNKWVFTLKRDKVGNVERFKARLVAKGCSQIYGVNFTETYSPVVRYDTIRMLFAIAAEYGLYMHQMDVSTAYLNSELADDIYMCQPEQFRDEEFPHHVLKLKKALYGLKQSGRQWNLKLDEILREIGFLPCSSEPCVYTKHHNDQLNIIAVYVDDLLVLSSNRDDMIKIKRLIAEKVEVVDKGPVQHFLSIEVERDDETGAIAISQKGHINKLLKEYGMEMCRPISIPLDPGHQMKCEDKKCKKVDQTHYQSLIGSLMYLAISTRPDILHSVCKLSQRKSDPHSEHLAAAKRVLKYLYATQDKRLHFHKTGKPMECYVDADWGSDTNDRMSYTGFIFLLAGGVFSYESKKQLAVALSSTEAEYMALSSAVKEAIFLKKLLKEMQLACPEPISINGDNISAMNLVKNPVYHSRSKHIEIKYHHVRDVYKAGEIELKYCSTNEMIADVLTKNLPKVSHQKFTNMMGLY